MNNLISRLVFSRKRRSTTCLRIKRLDERIVPTTFMVTSLGDNGPNTLRQAIIQANSNGTGIDSINFNIPAGGTIILASQIDITSSIAIVGPAAKNITISGNNATRLFDQHLAAAATTVSFSHLTLINGSAASGAAIQAGDEQLTLTDCVLTGNKTTGDGAAIQFNEPDFGSLTLTDCTLANNSAAGSGGAIAFNNGAQTVLIERSTLSGNTSDNAGGALRLLAFSGGPVTIRNSTFVNNSAKNGGAIRPQQFNANLIIQNSTITNNTASVNGGGINCYSGTGTVSVESTIISGNLDADASTPDVTNGVLAFSYRNSAIGSSSGLAAATDLGGNLPFGANLKLDDLSDNGGLTQTIAPAGDSPLIDGGSNPSSLATDQTGQLRVVGLTPDIGAVEVVGLQVLNTKDAGPGSLRQTVQHANSVPGANTITFAATAFQSAQTITLLSGQINITDAVTINGPGARLATINGNTAARVFNIDATGAGVAIAIANVTVTGGFAPDGGGILVQDDALTLTDCAIVGNTAANSDGGGIHVQNGGSLVVRGCTISANTAAFGGAIDFYKLGGSLLLENSTLSGNSATKIGGAIYFVGAVGSSGLTIRNSTIANNSAGTNGGAIMLAGAFSQTLVIQNSTIVGNSAGNVGAIRQGSTGAIAIESSVIAGNQAANGQPDISSTGPVTLKNSAIGSGAGFTGTDQGGNIAYGTDLKLGLLGNNGGLAQTMLALIGSPLIDAGCNPSSLTSDQRGSDYPRIIGTAIDIGATEYRPPLIVTNTADNGAGSLRQAITAANASLGLDAIVFDPTVFNKAQTIVLASALPNVTGGLTITGPVTNRVTLSGGGGQRIMHITNAGADQVTLNNVTLMGSTGGALAIDNSSVALNSVVLANNKAAKGGAILFSSGNLSVTDSTLTGNTATSAGGGIYGLSASAANTITIERSTLSFNASTGSGGGIVLVDNPVVTVRDSTISGNTSSLNGGGVRLYPGFTGKFNLFNSTVANNVLVGTGVGSGVSRASGTLNIVSSIIAQNSGGTTSTGDLSGAVNINYSLIGATNGATITGANNQSGTNAAPLDAKLAPLGNYGGPTQTHALLLGSPALNKGGNPQALSVDQRGRQRTFIYIDIGAFETQATTYIDKVSIGDGTAQRSTVTSIQIEFSNLVNFADAPESAITLTRNGDNKTVNLAADVHDSGTQTTVTVHFTGGAVDGASLADGTYTLKVHADELIVDAFDGNHDGVVGDNYVLVGNSATNKLYRLFGDCNGDGTVNGTDFLQFRLSFLQQPANPIFDVDGDGRVNGADFLQFRLRFQQSI